MLVSDVMTSPALSVPRGAPIEVAIAILGRLETTDIDPLVDLRRDRDAGLALRGER